MSTKAVQGKLWSVAPQYWANHFEPYFTPMYKKTLEQLNLNKDTLILDAGCGSGLFSNMAIKADAKLIGMDAAPGLLELARKRNPENDFIEGDLETTPFSNNSFDVVAGFNSFQYAGDFEKALLEAKRVLKEGGRLVIGIWDKAEMSDASNVLKAIGSLLPPPPPGTPGPFALSEDGKMDNIIKRIGLKMVYTAKISCPFYYSNVGEGVKSFMGTGPAAAAVGYTNEEKVTETIINALRPYNTTEDRYFLQNQFLIFIAEK